MIISKRVWRIASGVALVATAVALGIVINLGRVVDFAMTPRVSFDAETRPPAPDYANPAQWSALPDRTDLADRVPTGSSSADPRQAKVDVFYVHPTSYIGGRWNAPTSDESLNDATDRVATGIQASVFNGCCAVYAPRYRQANGTAFYRSSWDGERAIELAYDDVRNAFTAFNAMRGATRPFILAGHSQGAIMLERLLYDVITGTTLRNQLVAAYLIGGNVTINGLRARAPDLTPCRSADELHCVVAWNSRSSTYERTAFEMSEQEQGERICTNPLSWKTDDAATAAEQNLGAVFLETEDPSPRLAFASAQCVKGTLIIAKIGAAPRDFPSRILDRVLGDGNYHPIEYQLFFMNLRQNASTRAAAFAARYLTTPVAGSVGAP